MKNILFILFLFSLIQAFGQIKGYWRLDGNTNDASGNGYNGTPSNITFSQANGKLNYGAGFNGANSIITIGNYSNLNLEAVDNTISFWIFPTDNSKQLSILWKGSISVSTSFWYVRNNFGGLSVNFAYSSQTRYDYTQTANNVMDLNVWNHIVITRNYSTRIIKVYKNGIEIPSTNQTLGASPISANTQNLVIGNQTGQSIYYKGNLDEIIIEPNSVWSPARVKNEYIKGTINFKK